MHLLNASVCSVLVSLMATNAIAQEGKQARLPAPKPLSEEKPNTANGDTTVLEGIVVTARKHEEDIARVPLSITVLTADDLRNTVADAPGSITRSAPNFYFADIGDPTQASYTMRGMGALIRPLNSTDTTVTFNYDGAPTTLLGAGMQPLDVQTIEVVRGPQSSLYGRSTLGGVVNVVTNEADGTPEVLARAEVGSDGYRFVDLVAGGTLIPDQLYARGAVRYSNFDGDIPNGIIGGKDGNRDLSAAHGTLKWEGSEGTTVTFSGFYENGMVNLPQFILRGHPKYPISGTDIHQEASRNILGGTLTVEHEFEFGRLTSVTGGQRINTVNIVDTTDSYLYSALFGLPPSFFANPATDHARLAQRERIFSQEVRLSSYEDSEIQWVGGVSYFRSGYNQLRNIVGSFSPYANGTFDASLDSQTYGAFGEVTVPLADRLKLTTGLRFARDEQDYKGRYVSNGFPGTVPFFNQDGKTGETYATGRASLSYEWTDELMTYVSIGRGHSSGGFDVFMTNAAVGLPETPFDPATSWAYEAGAKLSFLDDRASLYGSVFFNDVKNGPTYNYSVATQSFTILPYDYETKGFELEGRFAANDWLSLRGGVGYTHAELKNVPAGDPAGVRSGNKVPNAPEWTANAALDVNHPVENGFINGEVFGTAEYQFVGRRAADPVNNTFLKNYGLVNLSTGFRKDNLEVYAFARNVFDNRYEAFGSFLSPSAIGLVVGQGRTVGVGMTAKF
ncbi:iron complex outermembrane recepter protein [Ensifer sp. YR511]|nr:iron complex outermembrane recepter protein [Ensifer sp. YR511]